jgi:hypothetical protein
MPMLTDYIEDFLPGWARKKPFEHVTNLVLSVSLVIDGMIEGAYDGRKAGMPAQDDTPGFPWQTLYPSIEALPFIGRDRRRVRGFTETVSDYAFRLRRFRSAWRGAGTARGIIDELAAVLGPNPPKFRLVDSHGNWWTRETDGTIKFQNRTGTGLTYHTNGSVTPDASVTHPWDWDSHSNPISLGMGDGVRIWVIVYMPSNVPLTATETKWGDGLTKYGDFDKVIGTNDTAPHVEQIRGVLNDWKAGGVKLHHIIIAFDPASFDPLTPGPYPAAGMPDGWWGHHGKPISLIDGSWQWVRSRNPTARYYRGTAGTVY